MGYKQSAWVREFGLGLLASAMYGQALGYIAPYKYSVFASSPSNTLLPNLFLPCTVYVTPWNTVLCEKIIVTQWRHFPPFVEPRRFITVFTRACHQSLPWARWIKSIPSHQISVISILTLSSLRSSAWPFPFRFVRFFHPSHSCYMPQSHPSWFDYTRNTTVSKSFRTGRLARELQAVELSATMCSCIAILWVSLVSFATIILCVASQLVFIVYFVIDSVRKLLNTPS